MRIFAVTETDAHLRLLASRGLVVERRRRGAHVDRSPSADRLRRAGGAGARPRRPGWAAPGWSASTGRPARARPRSPPGWPPPSAPDAAVLHMDDLYAGWTLDGAAARLTAGVLRPLADGPARRLPPLRLDGGPVLARRRRRCRAAPVLVVEGCGSARARLDALDDAADLGGGARRAAAGRGAWPATAAASSRSGGRWQRDGGRGVRPRGHPRARRPAGRRRRAVPGRRVRRRSPDAGVRWISSPGHTPATRTQHDGAVTETATTTRACRWPASRSR